MYLIVVLASEVAIQKDFQNALSLKLSLESLEEVTRSPVIFSRDPGVNRDLLMAYLGSTVEDLITIDFKL